MSEKQFPTSMNEKQTPTSSPLRQTSKGVGWKLLVVLVALGAYGGIKVLESQKRSFDTERQKPIFIVDSQNKPAPTDASQPAAQTSNVQRAVSQETNDYIAITNTDLKEDLKKAMKGQSIPAESEQSVSAEMNEVSAEMNKFVDKLKYQPFRDANEILNRLSDEALANSAEKKKGALRKQEAFNKDLTGKEVMLVEEKILVDSRLRSAVAEEVGKEARNGAKQKTDQDDKLLEEKIRTRREDYLKDYSANDKKVFELKARYRDAEQEASAINPALYKATASELAVWSNTLDRDIARLRGKTEMEGQLESIEKEIKNADDAAQQQLKVLHTGFRKNLKERIKNLPGSGSNHWFLSIFDPRSVLDEKSGAYVIYQTCRTIALVVLVLFVLSLFLLVLRRLPFFASGSGTLMDQISGVFKSSGGGGSGGGEGAVPQFAKSLVVTAAALGIGTAVVVAGNSMAGGQTTGAEDADFYVSSNLRGGGSQPRRPRVPSGNGNGETDGATPVNVEFSPEIIHPEPIVIDYKREVAVFNPDPINSLAGDVKRLTESLGRFSEEAINLRSEVIAAKAQANTDMDTKVSNLSQQLTPQIASLRSDLDKTAQFNQWEVFSLNNRMGSFETNFGDTLKNVSSELTSTRNAVETLGRGQNSGGRNIVTATQQFLLGRNRYMATKQSYIALKNLMCKSDTPCEGAQCNAPCTDTDKEEAAAKEQLLQVLKSMIGKPPMKEDEFLENFKPRKPKAGTTSSTKAGTTSPPVNPALLAKWKSILLKYTRVAY